MKPRSLRLIVIGAIAAVSLGSSLLIGSGAAPGELRAASTNAERSAAPHLADRTDRVVASAGRRSE